MYFKLRTLVWIIAAAAGYIGVDAVKDWGIDKWQDYQQSQAHAHELEDTVQRSNHQLEVKNEQIKALETDALARQKEMIWARDRVAKREKLVTELRQQNNALQKILDSRIPVGLIR